MIGIQRESYKLFLSYDPCEIFTYFGVDEMHGLNRIDCELHVNNTNEAYIAGWCNYIPNTQDRFVFINLSRCTNDAKSMGLIFHELMHQSIDLFQYDFDNEEEMITWAENESYEVFDLIKLILKLNN